MRCIIKSHESKNNPEDYRSWIHNLSLFVATSPRKYKIQDMQSDSYVTKEKYKNLSHGNLST